ncbi:ribbon-helix-helix protein, CopG family [Alcanivorax sp. IL2]|uniref:ribbon-helix-helix protein, CopG family n=1 Tax=Alcanivorax sp. IL2 TaxID=3396310 RepID=UPI0039C11754|tara:strand:+ start:1594 stop:2406 length:813 start_codon:yes stop_codon:yes gene_type:complete
MPLNKGKPLDQLQSSPRSKQWLHKFIAQTPELRSTLHRAPDGTHFKLDGLSDSDAEEILEVRNNSLLPEPQVSWIIDGSQRQLIWTQLALEKETIGVHPFVTIPAEERSNALLLMLDIWPESLTTKKDLISRIKENWVNHRLKDKQLSWLDPKNQKQLAWAMDYLEQHRMALPISVAKPATPKEEYDYVVAALDKTTQLHPSDHKLFLTAMRKAWSQYKYRHSGKAKKPLYLFIEEEAKEKLDQIAKQQKRSRHDIVEDWILQAFKKDGL